MQTGDKVMERMLTTFNERKERYGLNYLMIGKVMAVLFPDGITLKTEEDHNVFHLFLMSMVKSTRLACTNLKHEDSAHDAAVYNAMLDGLLLPNDSGTVTLGCCGALETESHTVLCPLWTPKR